MGCSLGAFKASRWQLGLPRIPPNVDKSHLVNQTWSVKNQYSTAVKLQFLEVGVAIQISETFQERPRHTVIYDGLWHFARVRLRNRFILLMSIMLIAYYLLLYFQIVVFPPLGASR